jgi:hypothetical protein
MTVCHWKIISQSFEAAAFFPYLRPDYPATPGKWNPQRIAVETTKLAKKPEFV